MKRVLVAIILGAVFSLHAAAPSRGNDRLRELAVFPGMNLNFAYGLGFQANNTVITENVNFSDESSRLREELRQQPDDVKLLLRLGSVLDSNGETNESQSCDKEAERLCRNKLEVNPQDGLTLNDLGAALYALDKNEEAESVFRKATLVSSNEWICWVGLGNFLANQYLLMFPANSRGQLATPTYMPPQAVLDYRPTPDALEKAEAQCNDASRCFDRAVMLAPQEPEVYLQRAGYICSSNLQNYWFRYFHGGGRIDSTAWALEYFSGEMVADLQKAADLSPNDYRYISLAAYFEWMNAMVQTKFANITLDGLSDATRNSIHNAMARLENISEDSDKKMAAGALQNLGFLNITFGNSSAATADLRRAVSLDPTREGAWDLLLGILVSSHSWDEMAVVCESRLKYRDSAQNHLNLARVFENQEKWDKAGEQAEAALKLEPDNMVAHLELLALDLKQSADTNFMSKVAEQMTHTQAIYAKLPDSNEKQSRWRELTLNMAIMNGLVNAPEYQKAARACVEAVLSQFPNDKQAKEISDALD